MTIGAPPPLDDQTKYHDDEVFMKKRLPLLVLVFAIHSTMPADAASLLDEYARQARLEDSSFAGFSAARGKAFFRARHQTGAAETPSCTSCHTQTPTLPGLTRAGKTIAPLARSVSPERYTDKRKVEKWFRRNCNSVLKRACRAREKGDFITFMFSQ
jgi:hypothetical protein